MGSRKYYVVYTGGRLEEVARDVYVRGFDDPYVVLTVQEDSELFIEPMENNND